jgi:molybdopterin converting factor small subunit
MDIGLKLLYIKGLIQKNIWKVKLTREELQEKKPSAVAYINGAKDTENDLKQVEQALHELETELRLQGREINRCLQINGELKQRIEDLEHELKHKNNEL